MLDTIRRVETPEGIEVGMRAAGAVPRFLAYMIDLCIRIAIVIAASSVFGILGEFGSGLILITAFLVEWFYPVVSEVLWKGKTPGKATMGLRVVMDDGTPVSWSASLMRNLMRMADFLPGMYVTGLLCTLFHRDSKRLGDIAAGTIVIYNDPPEGKSQLPAGKARAPNLPLSMDEQRTIVDYAERGVLFSSARRAELANIVEPLTQTTQIAGVARLVEMARWYSGKGDEQTSPPVPTTVPNAMPTPIPSAVPNTTTNTMPTAAAPPPMPTIPTQTTATTQPTNHGDNPKNGWHSQ